MGDLCTAKTNLSNCLGANFKSYLSLLRSWFRNDLTKDEFDFEARKLFDEQTVKKHNAFLLALFNRCQDNSPSDANLVRKKAKVSPKSDTNNNINSTNGCSSKSVPAKIVGKLKNKKSRSIYRIQERRFLPEDPSSYTPKTSKRPKYEAETNRALMQIAYSSDEGSLPDHFMTNLRMLVIVWEAGLDNLTNESVHLLNLAVRDFMKNIIMSVLTFKSAYSTYDKGRLRHAVGAPAVNPYLKNSRRICKYPSKSRSNRLNEFGETNLNEIRNSQSAEQEAIYQLACSNYPTSNWMIPNVNGNRNVINMWHLFHALKLHKSTILSHSLYATCMEKIIMHLAHKCDTDDDSTN